MSDGIMRLAIEIPESTYEYYAKLADKGDEPLNNLEQIILNGEVIANKDEKNIFNSKTQYTPLGIEIKKEIKNTILPILFKYYIEGYSEDELESVIKDILSFEFMKYRQDYGINNKLIKPMDLKLIDVKSEARYACPICDSDFGNRYDLRDSMKFLKEAKDRLLINSGYKYFRCGHCQQILRLPNEDKKESEE